MEFDDAVERVAALVLPLGLGLTHALRADARRELPTPLFIVVVSTALLAASSALLGLRCG